LIIFNEQKNQLCNRLFAFLPSIAFALENNEKLLILFFSKKYLSLFPNLAKHPLFTFLLSSTDVYPRGVLRLCYVMVKGVGKIMVVGRRNFSFLDISRNKSRFLFVRGWHDRYAPSYLTNHYETIKTLFEPSDEVKNTVSQSLPNDAADVIVGVHLRRGDYKTYKGGVYYYADHVYVHFMNQLQGLLSKQGKTVWFLLCSNEAVSDRLTSAYNVVKLPRNDYITDLYALSCCNFLIGPPSTFSQWASFIGKVPLKFIVDTEEKVCLTDFKHILSIDQFKVE